MTTWRRYRLLQQADELAFGPLKIGAAAREAIREIDARRPPPSGTRMASLAAEGTNAIARALDEEEFARRDAIVGVLGLRAARELFESESAETSARTKRLEERLARSPLPSDERPAHEAAEGAGPRAVETDD